MAAVLTECDNVKRRVPGVYAEMSSRGVSAEAQKTIVHLEALLVMMSRNLGTLSDTVATQEAEHNTLRDAVRYSRMSAERTAEWIRDSRPMDERDPRFALEDVKYHRVPDLPRSSRKEHGSRRSRRTHDESSDDEDVDEHSAQLREMTEPLRTSRTRSVASVKPTSDDESDDDEVTKIRAQMAALTASPRESRRRTSRTSAVKPVESSTDDESDESDDDESDDDGTDNGDVVTQLHARLVEMTRTAPR